MRRPVSQRVVLLLQMGLPGLQLVEQAVEIVAELMQLGDRRRRHPQAEGAIAAHRVRHVGDVVQRTDDADQHTARQHQSAQGAEHHAGDHADQAAQQETQQAAAVAAQPDLADLFAPVRNRQDDRLGQRPVRNHLLQTVQRAVGGMAPAGQHLAFIIQNARLQDLFVGGDQHQRLTRGGAVFKHHGGLDGIADGARDQVQVVVGIGAQRKQRHQRQKDAGGADGDQRQPKMHPLQHSAQRRTRIAGAVSVQQPHSGGACLRASCSTLG